MEWNYVQIADDLNSSISFSISDIEGNRPADGFVRASQIPVDWKRAGFGTFTTNGKSSQQYVNMWYVALTRARKVLSLPLTTRFAKLIKLIGKIFDVYERRDDININIACAEYVQEVEPFFDNIKGSSMRNDIYPDEKTEILAAWGNYERIYENFKLDEHLTLPNIEVFENVDREEEKEMIVDNNTSFVKHDVDGGMMMMNSDNDNNNNDRTKAVLNDVLNSPKKNNGKRKKKSNNLKEDPNDVGGRKNKRRAK